MPEREVLPPLRRHAGKDVLALTEFLAECFFRKYIRIGIDARCLYLNDPGAVVTRVTITGGHPNFRGMKSELYANGAGLLLGRRGGTASWCRITGNAAKNYYIRGGGVALVGDKSVLAAEQVDSNKLGFAVSIHGGAQVKTNGTDSTHFSPEKSCTRAEIVTFLQRGAAE